MGVVGDWEVVASAENETPVEELTPAQDQDEKPATLKREAPTDPDPDDAREFKLRKKGWGALGADDYDPDVIPIKLKPKVKVEELKQEDAKDSPNVLAGPSRKGGFTPISSSGDLEAKNPSSATNVPKWTKISLKPTNDTSTTADDGSAMVDHANTTLSSTASGSDGPKPSLDFVESKQADTSSNTAVKTEEINGSLGSVKSEAPAISSSEVKVEQPDTPPIKSEVNADASLPPPSNEGGGSIFRKRKIRPAAATTGRRGV
jgi:WW domain-binding protein 4